MPEMKWALAEIRRQRRKANISYGIMVVMVAIAIVCGSGWSNTKIRLIDSQQNEERMAYMATWNSAGLAITMQGRLYEAGKAGRLEVKVDQANGRLGPMQRKINDLQEDVERLRTNWTSELGVDR